MAGLIKGQRSSAGDVSSAGGNKSIRQSPFASKNTPTGYPKGAGLTSGSAFKADRGSSKSDVQKSQPKAK